MVPENTKIEVYDRAGVVVLGVPAKDWFFTLPPDMAVAMANSILHAAQECGADIKFEVDKPVISEAKRMALVKRVGLIMRSMERVKDKDKVALQVVDSILSAIL